MLQMVSDPLPPLDWPCNSSNNSKRSRKEKTKDGYGHPFWNNIWKHPQLMMVGSSYQPSINRNLWHQENNLLFTKKKAKKKIYIVFKGSYGFIRFMSSDGLHTWRTFQNETQMPAVNRKTAPSAQFFLFTDSGGGCFDKRSDGREDDIFPSGLPLYRVATNAPEIHTKVPTILAWVLELLIFNFSNLEHHRYETQIHTHIGWGILAIDKGLIVLLLT